MNLATHPSPHDLAQLALAVAIGFVLGGISVGVFALRLRRAERLAGTGHVTLIRRLGEARGKKQPLASIAPPMPESRR